MNADMDGASPKKDFSKEMGKFKHVQFVIPDINCVPRGKVFSGRFKHKVAEEGFDIGNENVGVEVSSLMPELPQGQWEITTEPIEGLRGGDTGFYVKNAVKGFAMIRARSSPGNAFLENRLPSSAVNPYLALAATVAAGLFHKAIMESGVSLGDWAVAYPGVDPKPRERAVKLASEMGCETADSAQMVTCLRAKDAMDIINATTDMFLSVVANDTRLQFRPVVETTFGQSGVFAATPDVVLENGWFANVTTIRGFNSREYAMFFAPDQGGMTVEEFREKAKTFVRQNMAQSFFDVGIERITDQLVDAYLVKPNITDPIQRRAAAIELQSDFIFVAPTIRELQLTNKFPAPPQYLYRFSYRSPNRLTKPWQGAIHADELHYVFGYPLSNRFLFNPFVSNWTDEDRRVSQEVLSLWTNFAKYGAQVNTRYPAGSDLRPYAELKKQESLSVIQ
nr:hypothetical protein BaRGS_020368 [Batillaria attramentaria]